MAGARDAWTLALDQGGHATRALVFDGAGATRAAASVAIATRRPAPDAVEHDAQELIGSVRACLDAVGGALGADAARVGIAALCCQRSSVCAWSRADGAPLSPVLSWQDRRAAAALRALELPEAELRAITGLRGSPHYGASKLRWLLDHDPAVAAARAAGGLALGPLASGIVAALSDGATHAVDPCNASRTLLWDLATRDWSPTLCAAFGVPRELLPACRPNRAEWATLELGSARVPLAVMTGDQSAVPFAFEQHPGRAFLTLGTGAFLQRPLPTRPSTERGLLASVLLADGATVRFAQEGTINGAGAALGWLAAQHGLGEDALWQALPAWLEAERAPPLFVNAVGGLAAPFWRPALAPRFVGDGGLAAQAVAVVESVAFLVAANLEAMRTEGGPVTELVCVGGLARSDGLLLRIADAAEVPVRRAAELEASAYGAARLATPALPPLATGPAYAPDAARGRALRGRYAAWCAELGALGASI